MDESLGKENFKIESKFESYKTLGGSDVFIHFDKRGDVNVSVGAAEKSILLLGNAHDYLSKIVGNNALGSHFGITFGQRFLGDGSVVEMDIDELNKLANEPLLSKYEQDLDQSLVVHELTHMFEYDENLSMLIEMAFMMENGHKHRILDIKRMYVEKELPPQHVGGLEDIARWFGDQNAPNVLDSIANGKLSVLNLKDKFKQKVDAAILKIQEEG